MSYTFSQRAELATHALSKQLFQLMARKETVLSVSADVPTAEELIALADAVGPEICVLKTHIDTLSDFSLDVVKQLAALAEKHQFLIFEDRKFADIGNTVKAQYGGGMYQIAEWSHITNAHILPGEGIVEGLKTVGQPLNRGLLLLSEMSAKGHYFTPEYRDTCFQLAEKHADFVMGFICQQAFDDPRFIYLTPGVKLMPGKDALGQQYRTPEDAMISQGCDIVIVGRGIVLAGDWQAEAQKYRVKCWETYLRKISV